MIETNSRKASARSRNRRLIEHRAHHPVVLDPDDPDGHERNQVRGIRRPLLQQLMTQVVVWARQVEHQQGQGDGEDAVDQGLQSSWTQRVGCLSCGVRSRSAVWVVCVAMAVVGVNTTAVGVASRGVADELGASVTRSNGS